MKIKLDITSFALGFVFLIFGLWQIFNPNYWIGYLPEFLIKLDSSSLILRFIGIFNFTVGLALILNFYPLIFSGLAVLHLIGVILSIGIFNDVAIRDVALLILGIGIFWKNFKKS